MNKVIEIEYGKEELTEYKPEKVYMSCRPDGTRIFDGEFKCKKAITAVKRFCRLVPELSCLLDDSKEYGIFTQDSPFNVVGYGRLSRDFDSASIEDTGDDSYYIAAIVYP